MQRLRDNDASLMELKNGADISEAEARGIAEALGLNTTLAELGLRGNSLGDGGGQAIGQALSVNTTLTTSLQFDGGGGSAGDRAGAARQHQPYAPP